MPPKPKSSPSFPQEMEIPVPLTVHESVSPKAAELLEGVIEVLMREPNKYDQSTCSGHYPECGGSQCIIGWMAVQIGISARADDVEANPESVYAQLGLTTIQGQSIYESKKWPTPHEGNSWEVTPAQAIARISHFIITGQ